MPRPVIYRFGRLSKTPNIAAMAQHIHLRQFKTLREVLQHFNRAAPRPVGYTDLKPLRLSERELAQLEAFLRSLSGDMLHRATCLNHRSCHQRVENAIRPRMTRTLPHAGRRPDRHALGCDVSTVQGGGQSACAVKFDSASWCLS